MIRSVLLSILLALAWWPATGSAAPVAAAGSVAVVYPELDEPWRAVFTAIIAGVEEQVGAPVLRYGLAPGKEALTLEPALRHSGARVVVALGRQGLRAVANLNGAPPVVAGGILSVPDAESRSITGISLTPDPAILFEELRRLLPSVRRVVVVYNPDYNQWLIDVARAAARAQGIELQAREARDTVSAARLYEAMLTEAAAGDALWLPQDPTTVDDDTIVPLVLRTAWARRVPVFSSSFPHVRRGVLFALYPDNRQLGRALARTAQRLAAGEPVPQGLQPLQSVLTALNVRTASHLGLNLDYRQQRRFDFIFPEP
ncbi:MAG TPA: ABC transporter substrate binding protein [Moraxellaceae bacterium]|nr:ABC transporter substrate binding protein [Moraxellaceae bacterium]